MTSWNLAKYLIKEHRVAVVPGSIFGERGEGYLRVSFAVDKATLKEGIRRIERGTDALWKQKGSEANQNDEKTG